MFTPAFAQTAGGIGGASDLLQFIVPMAAVLAIMYVLVLMPQQRKAKQHQQLVSNVRRGDTIVTTGGLIGKVSKAVDTAEIELEIAPNVRVRLLRQMISEVRSKGEPVKDAVAKA